MSKGNNERNFLSENEKHQDKNDNGGYNLLKTEFNNYDEKDEIVEDNIENNTFKNDDSLQNNENFDVKKNKNGNKSLWLLLLIPVLAIGGIVGSTVILNNIKVKSTSTIDPTSETYQGKKITEKDGNTIIEEENNSTTIETKKDNRTYTKATDEIKSKYEISNVKVTNNDTSTIINGTIKNNKGDYKKVFVNVKFYANDQVAGSSSALIENLKKGKSTDFEIKTLGDFANYKYVVEVEYVD